MTVQCDGRRDQRQTKGVESKNGEDSCVYLGCCQLIGWLNVHFCP